LTPRTLAKKIADQMLSKKASDVVIIDLKKVTSTADYFVLCSADSDTQVKAIADAVRDGTEEVGEIPWQFEGYQALNWVVVDYVDVVAHVFYKEARAFYNLDRLWNDAKITKVHDAEDEPVAKPSAVKKKTTRKKAAH
jgi:ribosome-associated protein